jgi:NAD(P)-dependent dehydrogenase (short-subunit alcohol dehydrogenase family)
MLFNNQVIVITGSTNGIGEATARRCLAEGARVMIHGLEADLAQTLVRDLGEERSAWLAGDLADVMICQELITTTLARFGRIDALMNNAASVARSSIDTTNVAFFDRMMAVNLRAPLFLIQAATPHFRRQGGGVVLNIGSVNGLSGAEFVLDYSISKGGLITMTRNLANALAHDRIRVNHLNLGWVATPKEIVLKQSEGFPPGWENHIPPVISPRGTLLTPDEIAAHAAFWLSEQSSPASGVVYEIDMYSPIGRWPPTSVEEYSGAASR